MDELVLYLILFLWNDFIWIELVLLPLILITEGRALGARTQAIVRKAAAFAARRRAPYFALMAAAVGPRLVLLLWVPPAAPYIADEFSHRFLADTLLAGRLSNPTHPLWPHFETLHIFHTPTYSSMYMPGQALFLAAGKWITGSHWAGVLGGAMFAAASMFWALRSLLPPEWAFLGAAFYVCRASMFSTWTESYWGGHVAAAAGALLIGSAARLRREPKVRWTGILCLAITLLAWTRPFEGFVFTSVVGFFLVAAFIRSQDKTLWTRAVVAPALVMLLFAGGATSIYFRDVTGSPFKLPYQRNREIYGWPMTLPWLKSSPKEYRHQEHAIYYAWELSEHDTITNVKRFPAQWTRRILILFSFFLGPLLAWPITLLFFRRGGLAMEEKRLLFACGGAMCGVALLEQTPLVHYVAPGAVVAYALAAASWQATPERPRIFLTAAATVAVLILVFLCRATDFRISHYGQWNSWCDPLRGGHERSSIQRQIEQSPGKHVAIVRYNRLQHEAPWVYNSPNIDEQRVIWAQDMGEDRRRELLEYYPDRTFWIVEPDAKPPRASILKTP